MKYEIIIIAESTRREKEMKECFLGKEVRVTRPVGYITLLIEGKVVGVKMLDPLDSR